MCHVSCLCQIIPYNTCLCMYILYIFMYNIASSNVISIEYNNAESYSKKNIKPNNTSILTRKKVNLKRKRKKQECKEDQILQLLWVILWSKIFMDGSCLIIMKKLQWSSSADRLQKIWWYTPSLHWNVTMIGLSSM